MSELRQAVEEYLSMRRALGFELRHPGYLLHQFLRFAEQEGAEFITAELALHWAQRTTSITPSSASRRLAVLRRFAKYRQVEDPRTEVPAQDLLPHRYHRKTPYIYSDEQVEQLLHAAQELPSKRGLRSATFATFLGLLAVTGMRVSEAIHLDCGDVDLTQGVLAIRRTKFRKSRHVPIHASTNKVLEDYIAKKNRIYPQPRSSRFFLSELGRPLSEWSVRTTFIQLSRQIGLRGPSDSYGPRLHDLRHRFAVKALLGCYKSGVDVERQLPKLSTYLGHVHINDTYWYITAVPELLHYAAMRLETAPEERAEP